MKIIIVSGGMDSVTLLNEKKTEIAKAISFFYGQKHKKELEYAKAECEKLNIEHIIIDIENIGMQLKSNLLLTGGDIPEGHYEHESMRQTVVPFRNGIMLSIAIGIAESNNYESVLIANHSGDHAIYPDCREDFINHMSKASEYGTYNHVKIESPYNGKTKRDIAIIGKDLNLDYTKTWSCYKGQEKHCGKCGTCTERKEALHGFDNTEYSNV